MRRFLNVTLVVATLVGGACNVETAPAPPAEKPVAAAPAPAPAPAEAPPVMATPTPKPPEPAPAPAAAAPNERLVPTIIHGTFVGFKVFAMKPESIYLKAHFQEGDLIIAIDGEKITKPEDLGKIDAGLAKNGVVKLTVSRKGFKLPLPIELKK